MNHRQLEAFHAVIHTGSVTRAAERMGISQPAVSKLLKGMGDHCGFPLFVRNGNGLVPTKEGQLLAVEIDRLFAGTARIERIAEAVRDDGLGVVTLAAMPAIAARFLPGILAPILRDRPDLHLTLQSMPSPRIGDAVAAQHAELGLSVLPFEHAEVDAEVILRFDMVCVLPARHRLARRDVIRAADLCDEKFVSLVRDDCSLMTIDRALQMHGVHKRHWLEVPSSEAACAFIAGGAGVSILPSFVGLDLPASRLVRRRLEPETLVDLWLLTSRITLATGASDYVAGRLRAAFAPFNRA